MTGRWARLPVAVAAAAVTGLVTLAIGCGGYEYVPDRPALHTLALADRPGAQLEVRAVKAPEVFGAVDVVVQLEGRALPALALRRAWLAPTAARPCTAGWREQLAVADGEPLWRRPIALGGDARLELGFRDAGAAFGQPTVVDLEVATGAETRCLRIPLMDPRPEAPDRWRPGPWWLGFKLRSYLPLEEGPAAHDGHAFVIRFGRSFGWVNVGLSLEGGIAGCLGVCSDAAHYQGLVGAGPSLQVVLLDRGRLVVDLEAAYDFMSFQELEQSQQQTQQADAPALSVRGPRIGLGLTFAGRRALPGVPRDPRNRAGLEVFLAQRRRPSAPGGGSALVLGLSFTTGGPL